MPECRLATDVFPFRGVDLCIVRRDISGDGGGDADDASTGAASNQSADDDDDDWVDPNFFDEGYSVAATTGFCRVWEGAEVLTRLLEDGCSGDDDPDASTPSLRSRVAGKRVLELGSGVGLCGIAAASAGAHVMCTDLEAVVEGVLYRNIGENTSTDDDEVQAASSSQPWRAGERIKGGNSGTCVAQVLDWTKSIDDAMVAQGRLCRRRRVLSREDTSGARWPCIGDGTAADDDDVVASCVNDPRDCELVMAAECLWLRELVDPFCDTVTSLMRSARERNGVELPCVLSFRDRSSNNGEGHAEAGDGSPGDAPAAAASSSSSSRGDAGGGGGAFVPVRDVVAAFVERGCGWRTVRVSPSTEDEGYHVHVFEITPPPPR